MLFLQIVLRQKAGNCFPPSAMAETVISYLEEKGYLQAWYVGNATDFLVADASFLGVNKLLSPDQETARCLSVL